MFVPLRDDDPLVLGKDGEFGTADDLPANLRFMVLTRGQNQPGPDGVLGTADDVQDADNTDTPLVDQSQTYTSHALAPGVPARVRAGRREPPEGHRRLLGGPSVANGLATNDLRAGGMSTWESTKDQAAKRARPPARGTSTCSTSRCWPPTPTATSSPGLLAACRST